MKCQNCEEWQKVTGCKTPQDARVWLTAMQMDIAEVQRELDLARDDDDGRLDT